MSKKSNSEEIVTEKKGVSKKDKAAKKSSKKESKDKVAELEAALESEKDRNLRLFAEFENYKRRTGKERIELFKTASQDVMIALLPVLDDFDRALKELEKAEDENVKGIALISNKLKETLKQKGLEAIETEAGQPFNADHHEAVTQIPAPTEDMKGKIIDVIEKGYTLGEKIIRYPKVVIGQ
ncbi:MAG: nucleotide exchange factor GrpE [Flavobacteriaceae bacterium]|nr:nucleotide exchange factor GrpE [Flavobacteriaceae bacterium]